MKLSNIDYNNRLKKLAETMTAADKQDALVHCKISRPTLDKYLSGCVVRVDTATSLIEFFTSRTNQKIKDLKESLN